MNSFKKVISYTKPYRRFAILNIIFNILYAVFNVLSVLGFIPVLGILFGQEEKIYKKPVYSGITSLFKYVQGSLNYKVTELIDSGGIEKALLFICILSFSLFFFKNVSRYLASFFLNFLRNGVIKDLRDGIYHKILVLPLSYFSEKKKGDIIARMTSDIQEIEFSFLKQLEVVVREPLTVVLTLAAMFAISVKLTLFVFILLPVSGIIIALIGKKLKANSILAQQETGNFISFIEETLTGLRVIKGFNAENKIESKFTQSTSKFKLLMNSVLHRKTLASPMSEFLGSTTIIAILYFGGRLVLTDSSPMKPEEFFGYIGLFYLVLNPAKAISTASYEIQKGTASAERIFSVIDTENTIVDKPNAFNKTTFENNISFENISFKYKNDYVLKNFSLEIKKGETVALVGQSGSGKSTLANLITRFYDVNEGSVKIDGQDIRDLKQKSLRNLMGIVTQESILFNDTVKNNICLGVEHASDKAILKASNVANAYEFIKDLPEQFETNIGDSGNTLSGGQKQRLSIARAVLKNPPIMVLDEATSALDTESEQLVQKALEEMTKNRTSLVIAHRLSTIQNADKIVVLRKGKIVEQGKHDELLANKGEYFKLVTMQSL